MIVAKSKVTKDLSTHDLTRRSTEELEQRAAGTYLSTHDLTRRSTGEGETITPTKVFQLTTSQGGRLGYDVYDGFLPPFQLTTSQGGRPPEVLAEYIEKHLSTHDLTRRSTVVSEVQ